MQVFCNECKHYREITFDESITPSFVSVNCKREPDFAKSKELNKNNDCHFFAKKITVNKEKICKNCRYQKIYHLWLCRFFRAEGKNDGCKYFKRKKFLWIF